MSFDFQFATLQNTRQLKELVNFIAAQDLSYPHYQRWVQKAEHELSIGYKSAILAYSGGRLVGDLIFQPHKLASSLLEVKNLRIHPELRERNFARFMFRQLEVESRENYDALVGDVRAGQKGIITFLSSLGFQSVVSVPLYEDSMPDVTMVKFLKYGREGLIFPVAQKIVYQQAV